MLIKLKTIFIACILVYAPIKNNFAQLRCDWNRNSTEHMLKTNLLNLPFKTFNLEYERTFRDRTSLGINAIVTPSRDLPFKNTILNQIDEDDYARLSVENSTVNQFSITPYVRFYFGDKDVFTGFYAAPYIKYSRYGISSVFYQTFADNTTNTRTVVETPIDGHLNTLSIGSAIGYQVNLFSDFFLDWRIIGNHYGIAFGKASGTPDHLLTPQMQDIIRERLNNLDKIPTYSANAEVNESNITAKPKGAIIGISTALSIGYKF